MQEQIYHMWTPGTSSTSNLKSLWIDVDADASKHKAQGFSQKKRTSTQKNTCILDKSFFLWHIMQIWFHFSFKVSKKPHTKTMVGKSNSISLLTDFECVFLCKRIERACGCWVETSKPDVVQIVECWVASTINKQFNKHFSSLAVCWMFQPNEENLGRNSKDRSYLLQIF